ncbi:MAG: carboxylating nicotinate-nucleotide diphosphorylase [Flavobacteriaceae bacterium]
MPKPRQADDVVAGLPALPAPLVDKAVRAALEEDLGLAGDITTTATVAGDARSSAVISARKEGVIAGLDVARAAFAACDPAISFTPLTQDGDLVSPGTVAARIEGLSRGILTGERTALNFMCHMSGIATLTRQYVEKTAGTKARICCTRKTNPGLRAFEKYAVRAGGGSSHRYGLFDAVLIKDNHIVAAGGIAAAIGRARAHIGHLVKIEIEVDGLDQLREVMAIGADVVLLDNMKPAMLAEAVGIIAGRALAEASGGVNLDTVEAIAKSGVDLISVGALTHSAPVLDLGLDFVA